MLRRVDYHMATDMVAKVIEKRSTMNQFVCFRTHAAAERQTPTRAESVPRAVSGCPGRKPFFEFDLTSSQFATWVQIAMNR